MIRLILLLPLAVSACTAPADLPRPVSVASGPVALEIPRVPAVDLRGRWTIAEVNGRPVDGLWLELCHFANAWIVNFEAPDRRWSRFPN